MGVKLNLNLDKATSVKPVIIFHSIHYKGTRFRISTGQSIEPRHWDKEKQQVRRTRTNYDEFNSIFKQQANDIERSILRMERTNQKITKEALAMQLSWISSIEVKSFSPLTLFKKFIEQHRSDRAARTLKGYNTTLLNLTKYQNILTDALTFDDFNDDFYKGFRSFLSMYDNAFGFYVKNLKTFLNWAKEKGFHDSEAFRKWKIPNEDGKDHFFLKHDEILLLTNTTFEPRLERVRDLFLMGCYCGLRYSDLVTLKPIHVREAMIYKVAMKTNEPVKIPVIPELQELFNKYWNDKKPLPEISNQKGNEYLKELAKIAGLTRKFNYIQKKQKTIEENTYEAWQMMTWHVARHSFITNCIQLGVPQDVVRRVVGHASFKTLKKYIQNDDEFNKKQMMKLSRTSLNKKV